MFGGSQEFRLFVAGSASWVLAVAAYVFVAEPFGGYIDSREWTIMLKWLFVPPVLAAVVLALFYLARKRSTTPSRNTSTPTASDNNPVQQSAKTAKSQFLVIDTALAPPADPIFGYLTEQAVRGSIPVYGVVLDTSSIRLERAFPNFHPEETARGAEMMREIGARWNTGKPSQPWLYFDGVRYVVADDYLTLAAIERGRPSMIAAQLLGTPDGPGVVQKVGPLPLADVRRMLGISAP